MRTSDFDYELPPELIAQEPAEPRDSARLLILDRASGSLRHAVVRDLADLLAPGDLLARLEARGVGVARLVLHIGLDTFRPVEGDDLAGHAIHREWYVVPDDVQKQLKAAKRVIAVGTTTVRALETWAATAQSEGWTDLFILPGFQFQVVDGLLTNFHLPRSTLLMLVSAFAGRERILAAYAEAVREGYRFYSFGDAMLLR